MARDIEGKTALLSRDAIATSAISAKDPAAKAPAAADSRGKRLVFLAVSIAVAAVTGSMAGGLAALGLIRPLAEVVEAVPMTGAYETRVLQGAITVLRTDLAALKTSVELDAEITNAQLAKLGERLDRIDRPQAAREVTGSTSRCRPSSPDGSCATRTAARRSPKATTWERWK